MIKFGKRKIAWYLGAVLLIVALTLVGWQAGLALVGKTPNERDPARSIEPETDYLAQGKAYQQSGDDDQAIAEFTKAIAAKPKDAQRYVYRGAAYVKKQQYSKAIVDLNEAIRLNANDPEPWVQRGLAFAGQAIKPGTVTDRTAFCKNTVSDLTEALRLSPEGPTAVPALINRGYAYEVLGEDDKALADYEQAHRLNPKSAITLEYRAGIYVKQSKFREALAELDEAVSLQSGLAELRVNRGIVYEKLGQLDRAIEDYNEAIRLDPKYAPAYIDRGRAYRKKGEQALAAEDFKKARELQQKQVQR